MILANPGSGTHWFIFPNDEKWARRSSRITGSKKTFGSGVTATVLVRMISGDCVLGDTMGLFPQLSVTDEGIITGERVRLKCGGRGGRVKSCRKVRHLHLYFLSIDGLHNKAVQLAEAAGATCVSGELARS
jgi:hypothetical protein